MRVTGKVTDTNGQSLQFANVYYSNRDGSPDYKNIGTTTNSAGKYDLGTFVGSLHITASFVGYSKQTKKLPPEGPGTHILNFELQPTSTEISGVNITATRIAPLWQKAITAAIIAGAIYGIYKLMRPRFS